MEEIFLKACSKGYSNVLTELEWDWNEWDYFEKGILLASKGKHYLVLEHLLRFVTEHDEMPKDVTKLSKCPDVLVFIGEI